MDRLFQQPGLAALGFAIHDDNFFAGRQNCVVEGTARLVLTDEVQTNGIGLIEEEMPGLGDGRVSGDGEPQHLLNRAAGHEHRQVSFAIETAVLLK